MTFRPWLIAALLPILISVVFVPDLWLDPMGRSWANPEADGLSAIWTLWFVLERLSSGEWLASETVLMGYPQGGRLWPMHPVQSVLVAPVTAWAGAGFMANLLVWIHLGLAGGLMAAVLRRLGAEPLSAVLATPVLSLSPVVLCSIQNGNLEISAVFWIPLSLLLAMRASEHSSFRRLAVLVVTLAGAILDSTYIGICSGLCVTVWLLGSRSARLWGAVVAGTVVLVGPLLALAVDASLGSNSLIQRTDDVVHKMRRAGGAVGLEQWLQPGIRAATSPSGGTGEYLVSAAPGVVLSGSLLLGLVCFYRRLDDSVTRVWCIMACLGVALAMGSAVIVDGEYLSVAGRAIPLPAVLIDSMPPFSMLTELWRFSILLHLAMAVGLAFLLSELNSRWGRRASLLLGIAVWGESIWIGHHASIWQSYALPDRSVELLLQDREDGPVLDLPLRQGRDPLYFQTQHGQPIGNHVGMASVPELYELVVTPGWTLDALAVRARGLGFRWLVIHDTEEMRRLQPIETMESDLEAAGLITAREGVLILVDLNQRDGWPRRPYTGQPAVQLTEEH